MTDAHEGVDDPRLVAEGEISLARLALDDAELQHAADHVANALGVAPALPEAHELLAALAAHPNGGPALWPLDGEMYVGTAVAHAHALAHHGEHVDALGLLVSAQRHEPTSTWADVPWVTDAAMPAGIDPDQLVSVIGQLTNISPDPCPDELLPGMTPYATLARHAAAAHPESPSLLWIASIFVRRLGFTDDALQFAMRSERIEPSDRAAIAQGYALRAQGRTDEALVVWERALTYNPGNVAVHADIAELLRTAGRLDEAIGWTEKALAIDPTHDCSLIARSGLLYERDGDADELVKIADLLRDTEPGTHPAEHADGTLDEASWRWWFGGIPTPSESVIDVLGQLLTAGGGTKGGELTVSSLEPPSALLAFGRAAPGFEVTFTEVLPPDPRVPVAIDGSPVERVHRTAWTYRGTTAVPAFPPPSAQGAEVVARLALSAWPHIPAVYDQAVLLADTGLDDLLGVMVHPPAPPSGNAADWPEWIRAVQAWACLGVAHHRTAEPWRGSTRRQVLADLAYGPEDWITEAAMFALIATAWTDPSTRTDIAGLVGWRFVAAADARQRRPVTIAESLAALVLATPAMETSVTRLARDLLDPPGSQPGDDVGPPAEDSKRRSLFRRRR